MSHTAGLTVFAFSLGCDIGIDVERIHPIREMQSIACECFCSDEAADLRSLEPNLREHAFFLCWTRKEAYVKATGDGLFASLSGFRVTLRPTESAKLVHVARDTNEAKAWTLHDLDLADGYAAAVAYRDAERQVAVLPIVEPSELLTFALHCKEGRGRGPSSFL